MATAVWEIVDTAPASTNIRAELIPSEIGSEPDTRSATALVVPDEIHTKLASITTLDEAKQRRDEIATIQHYLKRQRAGLVKQNKAALFKFRVERRAGELLLAVPKVQGKRDRTDGLVMALKRSGISPHTGYRWMSLARIPEPELLRWASACDTHGDELTSSLVYDGFVRQYYEVGGMPDTDWRTIPPYLIKAQLIEWQVLDESELSGLPIGAEEALVMEVRSFYEHYCVDPARGKVPTREDEWPSAKTINERIAAGPSSWKTATGWYPPITCTKLMIRDLVHRATDGIRAGTIDTATGIRAHLYVRGVFDDDPSTGKKHRRPAPKKYHAPVVFTRDETSSVGRWSVAAGRFMKETQRLLRDPESIKASAVLLEHRVRQLRVALDQVQRAVEADGTAIAIGAEVKGAVTSGAS